ncbi:hypothetical protein [Candidatus Erwinia dacicola]|uniref:Uncharacterized protein n=1 Tax=Candidatus Erwinia dacicola TaxID=252393 RepID=A0A1E7Z2K4_9GAMM|nr:hypothetical protein [Candidatus Erwinia dacicola]OFC62973.1 hypothetical protein BBW68_07275 [Candidatus Erwinia dacicola]RAP72103.1 hypothetical protein ACZ87_01074 [Candidatus Erwinia dacicola]
MIGIFSLLTISLNLQAEELLKRRNIEPDLTCANGPAKIKDLSELNLVFGDYSEEDGNLKIIFMLKFLRVIAQM